MNEIVIDLSKKKMLLVGLGALTFVALGIWMFTLDAEMIASQPRYNNPTLIYTIGIASTLFFGAIAAWAARKLFDSTPGLVLKKEGFIDNSSSVAAGLVPWSEVKTVVQSQIQGQKFVSIHVHDPEKYIERSGVLKKIAHRANMKLVGTPINISANSLKIRHEELMALFTKYAMQE